MQLRDIEYFLAVAEHGQVGRAADACHVSQPTLSMQLRKMEEELGLTLFERLPRSMRLTAAGEALLPKARAVMQSHRAMLQAATHLTDPLAGEMVLGVFPTLAPYLLPRIVPAIQRAMPQLNLRLVEEKTPTLEAMLQQGDLDAALLALPVAAPNLSACFLFHEPFLLACGRQHTLATGKKSIHLDALQNEDVLLLEEGHCLRDQALSICQQIGADESRAFRATSLETLRQMLRVGPIVTLMPKLAADADTSGEIVYRSFAKPAPGRDIALVMRSSDPRGRLMGALESAIQSSMKNLAMS
jgi:LysR family hydrogen peroxide-inducible transcriptional activator